MTTSTEWGTRDMKKALGIATVAAVLSVTAIGATSASAAIVPTPTTTTIVSSANPSVVGQAVTFTATVTKLAGIDVPLGSVQFLDAGSPLSGVLSLASGPATFTTSALTAGSHTITAQYLPDSLDLASVSSVLTQVVNTATGGGGTGGGGGGGIGGICIPGVTPPTPKPTITSPTLVVGPKAVTVKGVALANDAVDLYQQSTGDAKFAKVGTTTASSSGAFSFTRNVSKQTAFAVLDHGACGDAGSGKIITKVALAAVLAVTSPHKGKLRMHVATHPAAANRTAKFYRVRKGGTRRLLAKVATGPKGVAHKTVHAKSGKRYRVIAVVSAPVGNLAGTSHVGAVRIK